MDETIKKTLYPKNTLKSGMTKKQRLINEYEFSELGFNEFSGLFYVSLIILVISIEILIFEIIYNYIMGY